MRSTEGIEETPIRFEGFTIDTQRRGLFRDGNRIHLTPTPFKTLVYLAKNSGLVVSKEQLLDAVWGEQRDENTVEQAVRQIRRALGDEKEQPRFIQTIPGEGYCFIAKLHAAGTKATEYLDAPHDKTSLSPAAMESDHRRFNAKYLLAGAIAILGSVLAVVALREASAGVEAANPTRITRSQTHILSPLLDEGTKLLYPQYQNGKFLVTRVPIGGGISSPVPTGVANAEICDVARSKDILLLRDLVRTRDEDEPLYVLPKDGAAQRVGEISAYDAAWFPDSARIIFSIDGDVFSADTKGGTRQRLFNVSGNAYWFRWSPDGKRLRFTVIDGKSEMTSLWEFTAGERQPHRLFSELSYHLCCGSWTPDGKFFLFQARVGNTFQVWVQRDQFSVLFPFHNRPRPLVFGAMSYRSPLVGSDGSKLFVRAEAPRGELAQFDSKIGRFISILPSISVRTLEYSPDRKWIAYTSLADNNLWRCRSDGTECLQLTQDFKDTVIPRWSPDGQTIAFMGLGFTGEWGVYAVPTNGGSISPLAHDSQAIGYPDWSPQGQKVAFSSVPPVSQVDGIRILDLHTNKFEMLPESKDYFFPRWSPDGQFLVAIHSGDLRPYLFDLSSTKWRLLADVPASYPIWSHDGRYVYFRPDSSENRQIVRVAITGHTVEKVASLDNVERGPYFMGDWMGLSPDDAPLVVQNMTTEDIYSWDLIEK